MIRIPQMTRNIPSNARNTKNANHTETERNVMENRQRIVLREQEDKNEIWKAINKKHNPTRVEIVVMATTIIIISTMKKPTSRLNSMTTGVQGNLVAMGKQSTSNNYKLLVSM